LARAISREFPDEFSKSHELDSSDQEVIGETMSRGSP
jgi:hypothetical protein